MREPGSLHLPSNALPPNIIPSDEQVIQQVGRVGNGYLLAFAANEPNGCLADFIQLSF
ncbi:hypothetical protein ACVWXO_009963 [Bradyrhizobium sp. LM2.7]